MRRLGLLIPLFFTGCTTLNPTLGREVDLMVYPNVTAQTLSIIDQNTLASIATMDILPYVEVTTGNYSPISSVTGNATTFGAADMLKLTQASPTIDPSRPFVVRKLKPNKNYRIFGKAYNASNALISFDSSSYVDVAVGSNDAPSVAQLPINLVPIPFAATATVSVTTEGRYDYLKGTLYLVTGNTQAAVAQTSRSNPEFSFGNLQGNTNYRVDVDAYKLGTCLATNSLAFSVTNDTAPPAMAMTIRVPYVASTLAGSGGTALTMGNGVSASFGQPHGLTMDAQGNLYIAGFLNSAILKMAPDGAVSVFAGSGVAGSADGTGASASFAHPVGLAFDNQGNLFVADYSNNRIRKITSSGVVSTLAGSTLGFADGAGTAAQFNQPRELVLDSANNIYVAERGNHRIRKITPAGVVTTFAGNGSTTFANGNGTAASFSSPEGVVFDAQQNLYVTEYVGQRIRKITPAGDVTTFAGSGVAGFSDGTGTAASFYAPHGIAIDNQGNLIIGDYSNRAIRRITPAGVVTTLAGNGSSGWLDGTGIAAKFAGIQGIAVGPQGELYLADEMNHRLRKMQ